MRNRQEKKIFPEEAVSGIVNEFKLAANFYRMEYSDDLTVLFNEFGYLLICRLVYEGFLEIEERDNTIRAGEWTEMPVPDFSVQSVEEMNQYIRWMELGFQHTAAVKKRFAVFKGFELTIKKASVLRQMLMTVDNLICLLKEGFQISAVYEAMCRINDFCMNNKAGQGRFVLPDEMAEVLVRILKTDKAPNFPETVMDPQYGSGRMLTAASYCLPQSKLYGYENEKPMELTAQILWILSGVAVETFDQNFLEEDEDKKYDMILAIPPFSSENLPYDLMERQRIRDLGVIKGKYNFFIARIAFALEEKGRAAIVVPDSFLFSSKKETVTVRRYLLESYRVEAVISLPEKTFYPMTTVKSSILILDRPFMESGWREHTEHVFFYRLAEETEEEKDKSASEELLEIWGQRRYYYEKWQSQLTHASENYNNVTTPAVWEQENFWFAPIQEIEKAGWTLLADHYQPAEEMELNFEAPDQLLSELMQAQKAILQEMEALLEEVESI